MKLNEKGPTELLDLEQADWLKLDVPGPLPNRELLREVHRVAWLEGVASAVAIFTKAESV